MKVIIAGDRNFEDYDVLLAAVEACPFEITQVVSGRARGVDTMGERWSEEFLGEKAKMFPAEWNRYGKGAGPKRNNQMANYGECLLALWHGRQVGGTWNMIKQARKYGLKVWVHGIEGFAGGDS